MTHRLILQSDNTELLIEYIDDYYNIYRLLVGNTNPVVENLLGGDVVRFKKLIETDIKFSVRDKGVCNAIIDEPITLNFSLGIVNSSNENEKINLLTRTVKQLESSNTMLLKRLTNIENLIPYYGIPRPWHQKPAGETTHGLGRCSMTNMYETQLNIVYGNETQQFDLNSLKLLKLLTRLCISISQTPTLDSRDFITEDKYIPIGECATIEHFTLKYDLTNTNSISKLTNVAFLKNLSKLTDVTIVNATHLVDIDVLYSLPALINLKLVNCGAIVFEKSRFNDNVKVVIASVE